MTHTATHSTKCTTHCNTQKRDHLLLQMIVFLFKYEIWPMFVAVCCLTRVEVCCSLLQFVAVCCSVLYRCIFRSSTGKDATRHTQSVLRCVAVCCSVLQCVAVCCTESPGNIRIFCGNTGKDNASVV